MLRLWRYFGDCLDSIDLGGWLCLFLGVMIVLPTVLLPAWLDVRQVQIESARLQQQSTILDARYENYRGFLDALEGNDPQVLQRLAWHHLRLKPIGARLPEPPRNPVDQDVSIDHWMKPTLAEPLATTAWPSIPDTRLTQLALGNSRIWVLAFGGWLILMGLLITPRARPA